MCRPICTAEVKRLYIAMNFNAVDFQYAQLAVWTHCPDAIRMRSLPAAPLVDCFSSCWRDSSAELAEDNARTTTTLNGPISSATRCWPMALSLRVPSNSPASAASIPVLLHPTLWSDVEGLYHLDLLQARVANTIEYVERRFNYFIHSFIVLFQATATMHKHISSKTESDVNYWWYSNKNYRCKFKQHGLYKIVIDKL